MARKTRKISWLSFGLLCSFILTFWATAANSAELSLISGVLQRESYKVDGDDGGSKTTISANGRFGDGLKYGLGTYKTAWFVEGGVNIKNYSAPDGGKSPDDSVGLVAGGGLQIFFTPFSERIAPYLGAGAYLKSDKDSEVSSQIIEQTETRGLYYAGMVGMKFKLDNMLFMFLETKIFESALYAVETTETTTTSNNQTSKVKSQTTKVDLYVDSKNVLTNTAIGVGLVF